MEMDRKLEDSERLKTRVEDVFFQEKKKKKSLTDHCESQTDQEE